MLTYWKLDKNVERKKKINGTKYYMLLRTRFLKLAFDSMCTKGTIKATRYLILLIWKYLEPGYIFKMLINGDIKIISYPVR